MSLKAEHVYAFRNGNPFSKITLLSVPDDLPAPSHDGIAYAHGVLAWINRDPSDLIARSIGTLDLKTHMRKNLMAEDRTSFHTVAMSSSIIAALDHAGRCHVWDVSRPNRRYLLQLPSAGYDKMEASGPALAIASSSQNTEGKIEIFTWSSQSLKTQSFLLPLHPVQPGFEGEWKMMLDSKGESLCLFQKIVSKRNGASDSEPNQRDNFYFTRTSLDGQICAQGRSECLLTIPGFTSDYLSADLSKKIRPVEVNGSATLWLFFHRPKYDAKDKESSIMIRLSFNFEQTSFEVERRKFANDGPYHDDIVRPLIWKDIIYWGNPAKARTRIFDFKESTCEETMLASYIPSASWDDEIRSNNLVNPEGQLSLGDEKFLIHMGPKGWEVWCFDKNIQMANEHLVYTRTR